MFPPHSRPNKPFAIFVQFVLLPSMLRRKIKQLVDPTELVRFPYQTTLHEHATTYLAHKARLASLSPGRPEDGWIQSDELIDNHGAEMVITHHATDPPVLSPAVVLLLLHPSLRRSRHTPFRAPKQHRGLVVARRILRRRAAGSNAGADEGGAAAELAGGTIAHSRARSRVGAQLFILLWTAIIVLPEDAQVRAMYDLREREERERREERGERREE